MPARCLPPPPCSHNLIPTQVELRGRRSKHIKLPNDVVVDASMVAAVESRLRSVYNCPHGAVPLPTNFQVTAAAFAPGDDIRRPPRVVREGSPQTDELLSVLGLEHRLTVPFGAHAPVQRSWDAGGNASTTGTDVPSHAAIASHSPAKAAGDVNEVDISDVMESGSEGGDPAALDIDDLL